MVHVKFNPDLLTTTTAFENFIQTGSGEESESFDGGYHYFHGGKPFQRGFGYYQNGSGISDILRHLWRTFLPVLKSTGKVVGKEALQTGSRILEDIARGGDLKESLTKEAIKGVENLVATGKPAPVNKNQQGSGRGGTRKRGSNNSNKKALKKQRSLVRTSFEKFSPKNRLSTSSTSTKRARSDAFGFY